MPADKINRKTDQLEQTLTVLVRLTSEAGILLDVLGSGLNELTQLTAPIHTRATALATAHNNIAASKAAVDELIDHLDTSRRVAPTLEAGPSRGLDAFLEALQQLEKSNSYLQQHKGLAAVQAALGHSQSVFDAALSACEADFLNTLAAAARASPLTPQWLAAHAAADITEDTMDQLVVQLVPDAAAATLRRMAGLLLDAGYLAVLDQYAAQRQQAIGQLLRASVAEPLPAGAALAQLPSEALDRAIASWSKQLKALTLLMLSERALAVALWPPLHKDLLFADSVGPHLKKLVAAGRDIAGARQAPDKVFSLLDMHRQLEVALPALQLLQRNNSQFAPLLGEVTALQDTISDAAATLFGQYEEAVRSDVGKVVVADGTIHPLTAQVVSYLKRLLGHEEAAPVLFSPTSRLGQPSGSEQGSMALAVMRLLMALSQSLEAKARAYRDPALSALFLMNNLHYVVWSVESSTAASLLGQEWLERQKDLVEDWGAKYHEVTWMPLVNMLQEAMPPLADLPRLKQALKERYARFNDSIERIAMAQSGWVIPDQPLRAAVKRVIKDDVLGPYQEFLRRYADLQFTKDMGKYVRFAAADVAAIVDDDLFTGTPLPAQKLSLKQQKLDAIV